MYDKYGVYRYSESTRAIAFRNKLQFRALINPSGGWHQNIKQLRALTRPTHINSRPRNRESNEVFSIFPN